MDFIDNADFDWKTLVIVIGIIIGAAIFTRTIRWLMNKSFVNASEKLKIDPTRYKFFNNAVSFIIWFIAFAAIVSLIPKLKALAITLFAGAGIFLAILGFAAQEAFSNIIAGIFIVVFKPFRVGDQVTVGSRYDGIVEDITLRHTVINNFENKRVIIPNSIIASETIVNDSINDLKTCRWIEVGISYDSDIELASSLIQEECMKHPSCIDTRTKKQIKDGEPQIAIRLMSFGDSSVNLRASAWMKDPYSGRKMHSDINMGIKRRFDAEGIEIPFPYRTVVYKNDLPENSNSNSE